MLEAPATEAGALPTRVPGATASASAGLQETEAPSSRPRVRAHNTSFFGARRARDVAATEPAAEVTEPTQVVEEPTAVVEQETAAPVAEVTEETTEVLAVVEAEQVEVEQAEPQHVEPEHVEPVVAEQVEVEQAEVEHVEPVVAEQVEVEHVEPVVAEADVVAEAEPAETPSSNLNDTPIFRAMMSRWLTDDSGSAPAATSWSTNEADQAWSAAARIEETQPLEESAAGLPKRRPGQLPDPRCDRRDRR